MNEIQIENIYLLKEELEELQIYFRKILLYQQKFFGDFCSY